MNGPRQDRRNTAGLRSEAEPEPRADRDGDEWLPAQLRERCAALEEPAAQGEPFARVDYLVLTGVTILLPVLLIVLGSRL